jgi:hypothetical protein
MPCLADFHANGVLHLAILQQPYLDRIVAGTKTIESRFNAKRAAPYGKVALGDLVLLKESGQPVSYYFFAGEVHTFDLNEIPLDTVRHRYSDAIYTKDPEQFWQAKSSSRFCTLVTVDQRGPLLPLAVDKKDQRGWVTFQRNA